MTTQESPAENAFDSLAAMMLAYAEDAKRIAWRDHRQRLDLSEASVDALEAILAGQAAEDLESQTRLWGAYFGELIRRKFGGEWELTDYAGKGILVPTLVIRGSRVYPLMKIYRRLTLGQGESLSDFYKMTARRLGNAAENG